jgi:hypothetical protein
MIAIAYWGLTLFVGLTGITAGLLDALRLPPLYGLLIHLGYPPYFGAILGAWKVLGGVALLAPRKPLVKEWAYAGMFIDYSAAAASHLSMGDGFVAVIGPLLSMAALVGSWCLRPPTRRLML